jgi:putative FmdB family regulatory protein
MPTYEYKCGNCEHRFERFQSIKARPVRKCPSCGKASVQRLVGAGAGIIFKGSGFYETDYRSDSYKKAAESETTSTTDKTTTEKKTEAKAKESKPADSVKVASKDKKKSA